MKRFAAVLFYAGLAAWSVALGAVSNEIEFLVWAPRMLTAFFVTGVILCIFMLAFENMGMDKLERYLAYKKTAVLDNDVASAEDGESAATDTAAEKQTAS